jgi:hypothetical protein
MRLIARPARPASLRRRCRNSSSASLVGIEFLEGLALNARTVCIGNASVSPDFGYAKYPAPTESKAPTSEPSRALIIRPAINFAENTRYIVALRNMKDGSG